MELIFPLPTPFSVHFLFLDLFDMLLHIFFSCGGKGQRVLWIVFVLFSCFPILQDSVLVCPFQPVFTPLLVWQGQEFNPQQCLPLKKEIVDTSLECFL